MKNLIPLMALLVMGGTFAAPAAMAGGDGDACCKESKKACGKKHCSKKHCSKKEAKASKEPDSKVVDTKAADQK